MVDEDVAVSVVFAAYNEEALLRASVEEVLEGLRGLGRPFQVLVVENGSGDATPAIATALAEEHPEVASYSLPTADYGAALRHGILTARGRVVVNFDVDYYDMAFLAEAVALVEGGAAVVVATKRGAGARDERPFLRRLGTAAFAAVLRFGFGLRTSDTHGMKALDRGTLRPLAEACRLSEDLFDTELLLRAEHRGLPVAELPVHVEERRPARSSLLRRIARTPVGLIRLRRAVRRG